MSQISSMSGATLTAFFDDRDDAEDAVERLVDAGIPQSSVRLVPGYESDQPIQEPDRVHKGFFESLGDFFFPEEDRYTYAEGLRRGGYLVTVSDIPAGMRDTAIDILDDEGAVNLDEREESWRSEGWTGYAAGSTAGTSTFTSGTAYTDERPMSDADLGTTSTSGYSDEIRSSRQAGEEVIPVVQEQLRVGKRDVNLGRVRVRSYVIEEPVNEQVNLRDERVEVERRSVDRPLTGTEAAFQERTIEAEEHAEEAVVSKEARVVEEVSLRKDATEHEETVSDTVRRTEVEVEDDRDITDRRGTIDRR